MEKNRVINTFKNDKFEVQYYTKTLKGINKSENQDAFKVDFNDSAMTIAIADGLGSCKKSAIGSKKAVEIVCEYMNEKSALNNGTHRVGKDLLLEWNKVFKSEQKDYDTTLLYASVIRNNLIIGGIGDGMILLKKDDEYEELSYKNETFLNCTVSMSSKDAAKYFKLKEINDFKIEKSITIVLATDGISEDISDENKEKLIRYIDYEIEHEKEKELSIELENWIENWKSKGHEDDKTILIMRIVERNYEKQIRKKLYID